MARLIYFEEKEPVSLRVGERTLWVCKCGLSANSPLCDGSHTRAAKEPEGSITLYDHHRVTPLAVSSKTITEIAATISGSNPTLNL